MARSTGAGARRPARRKPLDQICLTLDEGAGLSPARALGHLLVSSGLGDARLEGVAERRTFWDNGQTIRVTFIDPSPPRALVDKVKQIAPEWTTHANLDFEFVRSMQAADVTVSFLQPRIYSSLVGTDSRQARPSLNLGFTADVDEAGYRSLILHEFGHALGLHHEHQNPSGNPIEWDPPAVYAYFRRVAGWDDRKTFDNVIKRLDADSRRYLFTEFDPKSIMLYAFPKELTTTRVGTERASELSATDVALIRQMYPGRGGAPSGARTLEIDGPALSGSLKPDSVDEYDFAVIEEAGYVVETTGPTDTFMGLYGPNDPTRLIGEDDDLGQEKKNARILEWLAPATYRAKVRPSSFRPGLEGDYKVSVKRFRSGSA